MRRVPTTLRTISDDRSTIAAAVFTQLGWECVQACGEPSGPGGFRGLMLRAWAQRDAEAALAWALRPRLVFHACSQFGDSQRNSEKPQGPQSLVGAA
jgi:hypothetical protein